MISNCTRGFASLQKINNLHLVNYPYRCLTICHKLRCVVSINWTYNRYYKLQILRAFNEIYYKHNIGFDVLWTHMREINFNKLLCHQPEKAFWNNNESIRNMMDYNLFSICYESEIYIMLQNHIKFVTTNLWKCGLFWWKISFLSAAR